MSAPALVDNDPATTTEDAPKLDVAGLDARSVSAWFGTHQVLDRVSLSMPAGQVTALIGPVRLWQVDVPSDPQPHARDDPVGVAGR